MNILIIEDTQAVSNLLKSKIIRWGHQVKVAETGQEGLDIIKKEIFDLILLDVFLPDTASYDLIPKLKQGWSGMEIITMTGYSSMDVEKKIRSQGITYYMVKPVDLKELESIIKHMSSRNKILSQCSNQQN